MSKLLDRLVSPMRHIADPNKIAGRVVDVAAARFDVAAPQAALTVGNGVREARLQVPEAVLTETGVVQGVLAGPMTRTAMRHLGERLRIPMPYLDRLSNDERVAIQQLADTNVNELSLFDDRRALYRYLRDGDEYLLRAVRSDRYSVIDNDSALLAIMAGLTQNELQLDDCWVDGDVTVDRLRLRLAVPAIAVKAPDLLGNYRSPFTGDTGKKLPLIWAGVEITNSETGNGAFSVAPRAVVQVCTNGLTRPVTFRRAHIGASLEDGEVQWSEATKHNALSLITSQVIDAVGTFISVEYLDTLVTQMRVAKGIDVESPSKAVEVVSNAFTLTEAETTRVLDFFAKSGDTSVLGLSSAVTAMAQEAEQGDRQAELEAIGASIVDAPLRFAGV